MARYDVTIQDGERKQFYISGRGDGLRQAKALLDGIIHNIAVRNFIIEQPGLRKTFERGKGDSLIKVVGKDHNCLIRIKKKFLQKNDGDRNEATQSAATETDSESDDDNSDLMTSVGEHFFVTAQRQKISWKTGNIAEEQVHTVVSPEGECSKAIRSANPAINQYLGNLQEGEISVSPGFNLPCNQVIHTCCSGWNNGQGEKTLRAIVQKSLHKVVELEGYSIAFPIIGTGILNFPPNKSCRIMLDETLKFCKKNPRSCLKDIRFIVFHQNQSIFEAFRQEMSIVQEREGKQAVSLTRVQNNNKMSCLNIEVVMGDLTQEKTDAIVNMIGPDMNMNNAGELSKSIALSSGPQIQLECSRLGQQEAGSAVITTGGNLQAGHVIHLVPGFGSFKEKIFSCLENCLQLAETRGLRSISLPAVGTGRYGISAAESADIIFQALKNFEGRFVNIRHVRIIISQHRIIKEFERKQSIHVSRQALATTHTEDSNRVGIEIITGDLTHENTDAIFNIINTDMTMSNAGELSKAIASAGGQQVEEECKRLGPQRGGTAVVTNGGNLKARYIIHLIPISSDKQHLQKCLEEGLRLADARRFQSISVPAIGTGGYGMSAVVSASMIFQALGNVCKTCVNIQKVRIVVLNQQLIDAFQQEQQEQKRKNVHLPRYTTKTIQQSVIVKVTGNDQESVSKAVDAIKSGFSDDCSYDEVKDGGVSILSESQVSLLLKEEYKRDVEMTIDPKMNGIILRGDEREVPKMVSKIFQEISQRKKEQEEQQEHENALMVAKTIDWAYEFNGEKTHFDLKTNYKLEMSHSKEEPSVKVSLRGDDFVIDLNTKMGYGQHNGEQVTLIRKLKQAEEIPLPEHWSVMKPEEDVVTVELDTTSPEYGDVFNKFFTTATGATITRIERVQNPFRYRSYMLRKQKMDKDNGGTNERQLFHGTTNESTNAINTQGFNRSFCGKNGVFFGQGVYFARDACYSIKFTLAEDVERRMYLSRVLVGDFCEGNPEMKAPPPKDPNRPAILYDSTVNKPVNPEIFVAFSDDQCYPEYLITFQYNEPPPV
ncbi:protein mono-ADP-ribosyltransferase PARP14-like [Oculina patagonica]